MEYGTYYWMYEDLGIAVDLWDVQGQNQWQGKCGIEVAWGGMYVYMLRMHACVYATQPCYSLQLVAWSYSNLAATGFISAHGLQVPIYKGT